jgi:hypothetical protein
MKLNLLLLVFSIITFSVFSQESPKKKVNKYNDDVYADTLKSTKDILADNKLEKLSSQLYAEFLGPGLGLSLNYDTRFKPGKTGLGFRIGAGITLGATIPIIVNYVFGNNSKRSFLELGAGSVVYFTNNTLHVFQESKIIPTTYIAYRYQTLKHSNIFRVGITQLYLSYNDADNAKYIIPSISIGRVLGKRYE